MIAACVTLVAALVTGVSPPVAAGPADDPVTDAATDARAEAARGEALFLERRFDDASAAYERAYELQPLPEFLFARARSEQEAHRCAKAIEIYELFKETNPPVSDVDRANMEIGRCHSEARIADPPAPRPEPAAVAPPPAVTKDAPPKPAPRATWIHDAVGGGMLGAGLIVLATGLGLFFAGDAMDRRADRAATTDDFRKLTGRARPLRGVGIAGISVGSVLLVAAITRFAIVARKARRSRDRSMSAR
jgi:tetratricopeptide (TPR) repeat protein